MTTEEFATQCGFACAVPAPARTVTGVFTGDLLSWAMGRLPADAAWFTVMGNVNTIAVATLTDCACVVLCHGAQLDEEAAARAAEQDIPVYTTDLPEFDAALRLAKLLKL